MRISDWSSDVCSSDLNAPMSFGFLHLSGAIPAFHDRFPQITVEAVMNDRFVDLIDEGYDVALRIGDLRDSSLVARRLAPCWSVLCASPASLEIGRAHV